VSKCTGCVSFKLKDIVQLFARVQVLPDSSYVHADRDVLHSIAVELATEVCNSNTAEKLVYTIQQLMFNEQDQYYRPKTIWPQPANANDTTFRDLEPWAIQDSNGTVTVDTDRLQAACAYVQNQAYSVSEYQWAKTLLQLSDDYFSKDVDYRVNKVLTFSTFGTGLLLYYLDSTRLAQLAQLSSLWDYDDKHKLSPQWIFSMDCAVVIEDTAH
jgi:hypothetical protein